MKYVNCACGTYYNWNCNYGTKSRSGHLLRLEQFNLHLDRFSQGIVNLVTKYVNCAWDTYYCRVSIKSTPLHDRDTPDKILVSSPCLEGCDKRKISSGV